LYMEASYVQYNIWPVSEAFLSSRHYTCRRYL